VIRFKEQHKSAKVTSKQRGKSSFNSEVLAMNLKLGEYTYASHKYWLDSLVKDGKDLKAMSAGSLSNGPRYSLKLYKLRCQAVLLSGKELKDLAESEGRELTENDIIYSITPMAQ